MPTVCIDQLEIQFPFQPYDVQVEFMKKVIDCLQNRENGLLESPTGTGKTLSLLCSTLAWQRRQKEWVSNILRRGGTLNLNEENSRELSLPKIIYSSRTHSQLSQAIQQLKRTFYKNTKAIVLGSRDVLCIHPQVSGLPNSSAKIASCHLKVYNRTCKFYNAVSNRKADDAAAVDTPINDIEDLVSKGKGKQFCPFFMSRELAKDAEIIFMPYNYLLDPKIRSSQDIDLKNSIIILDEGHNIAKICEEAVSFEIKSSTIAKCIHEITKALNEFRDTVASEGRSNNALTKDLSMQGLVELKKSFLLLEANLDKIETNSTGVLLPGNEMLSIIYESGFNSFLLPGLIKILDGLCSFLTESHFDTLGCDTFSSILRVLASKTFTTADFGESYKVFVQFEEKKGTGDLRTHFKQENNHPKVFKFWCFNPAVGLDTMMQLGPRCIILASGTLSPIQFLLKELRTPFPIILNNPHIIEDKQLFAAVIKMGPKNIHLTSSYQNRTNKAYQDSLGTLISNVCSIVPKGVLVFYPSYAVMELCTNSWNNSGIWSQINSHKKVFVEPKGKDAFTQVMNDYYAAVRTENGGCLMAVCRGKVSEGLDFADDNGRAVIITGIPYSPAMDPLVKAKQKYLDSKSGTNNIDGKSWYQMEAVRAVNQAIGRIIRHAKDYGAILLCDERCDQIQFKNNLSEWVQKRIQGYSDYDKSITELARFFKSTNKISKEIKITKHKSLTSAHHLFSSSGSKINLNLSSSSSSTGTIIDQPVKKKIKLAKQNTSFGAPQNLTTVEFKSVNEFWQWIKTVLTTENYTQLVKALKKYQTKKDVKHLATVTVSVFKMEHFNPVVNGFKLILNETDMNIMHKILTEQLRVEKNLPCIQTSRR